MLNLLREAATSQTVAVAPVPEISADVQRRRQILRRQKALRSAANEIGDLPEIADQRRRRKFEKDLAAWLRHYLRGAFPLPFSKAHQRLCHRTQNLIERGGLFGEVVFRGFGKSSIADGAALYAAITGKREFVVPVGNNKDAAEMTLATIQRELLTNDRILADYPAICYPIRHSEGIPQRCANQTHRGAKTHLVWTSERIVLPWIQHADRATGGAVILPRGITASLRGMRHKTPDGRVIRPDLIILDDPQTDESAASPTQTAKRLRLIHSTILRLGGHQKQIACNAIGTIIEEGDLMDSLADRSQHPAWQFERIPMLASRAKNEESFWLGEYADLRNTYDADDPNDQDRAHRRATAHYRKNRTRADAGANATWEKCFDPQSEVSAVQHAYNILIDTGPDAFDTECQGQPSKPETHLHQLTPAQIARKTSGMKRDAVPSAASVLTCKIDVHPSILYYTVGAFAPDFTSWIIRYGTWPDQRRRYFHHAHAPRTIGRAYRGRDPEAALYQAIYDLIDELTAQTWTRDDGVEMRLGRIHLDANGEHCDTVTLVCRQHPAAGLLRPTFGKGLSATAKRISQWQTAIKQRSGPEWVYGKSAGCVSLTFDANYWKTRAAKAWAQPAGGQGSLYLHDEHPARHQMFADHQDAEKPHRVAVDGREDYVWTQKANTDNHYLDCIVDTMVAASCLGITNKPTAKQKRRGRKFRQH